MFSRQNVKIECQLSLGGHTILMDYFMHVKSTGKPPLLIEVKKSDVSPLLSSHILTQVLHKVHILAESNNLPIWLTIPLNLIKATSWDIVG